MNFQHPMFLVLAAAVPLAAFMAAYFIAKREKAMKKLTVSPPRQSAAMVQLLLISVAAVLALFACARPQWGKMRTGGAKANRNLVVALDVSRSMLAEDVRPNRLERAKADLADLIDSLEGDRCALVAFRRTGAAICPLTTDRTFLRAALEKISIDSAPRGETDFGSALDEALNVVGQMDGKDGEKADHSAIIMISDGGDLRGNALKSAQKAKMRGVPVFTVGIGNPRSPSPIPDGNGGYVKHEGKTVETKLEDGVLDAIAKTSGGKYVPLATARTTETTLGSIYRNFLRKAAADEQNRDEERLEERYQLFLIPAIIFAIAAACLSKGRYSFRPGRISSALIVCLLLAGCISYEEDPNREISGTEVFRVRPSNGVWDMEYGATADPLNCSFVFRVLRYSDGIGVRATVRDNTVVTDDCTPGAVSCRSWDDDNLEVFFDGDNDRSRDVRSSPGRIYGGEYTLVANGAAQSDWSSCPRSFGSEWSGTVSRTALDSGFLIDYDLRFSWKCLGLSAPPDPGDDVTFGFNISVHDDDTGGRCERALYWTGNPELPYRDESGFKTITLKGEKRKRQTLF